MDITAIQALARDDRAAVDRLITERLRSDVVLINQLGSYIIGNGGKRLRPLILLLAARALSYQGKDHIALAAIVEFIHTATLLHDDVVDGSELRRGQKTANVVWGNEASVLVGDFLYSRAFEMMVEVNSLRVMGILANTTNVIAEGEVMQLMNCGNPDITEDEYFRVIYSKTARLFEAAGQLSAVITGQSGEIEDAMAAYGRHLGCAFQLIDDVLDYRADAGQLGKNVGDDLAEGKTTLPLIHALRTGQPDQQQLLREAILNGGVEQLENVLRTIESTGSIAYTARRAEDEARTACEALAVIPETPYKQALIALAHFAVRRDH
jgi:octaprenyl-diphosphate synthase